MATEENEEILPHLLPEIMETILLKLPVKSLLRFRAVSKSWNSLITDPQFCQTHLQSSNSSNLFLHKCNSIPRGALSVIKLEGLEFHAESVIKGFDRWNYVTYMRGGVSFAGRDSPRFINQSLFRGPFGWNDVVGYCNGVLLLAEYPVRPRAFALWNPSTRMVSDFRFRYSFYDHINYGLCYDAIVDDFKVVITAGKNYAIYSCKTRTWTAKVGYPYQGTDSGISVDGAVYWVWSYKKTRQVVYFDPRIDKLKRLQKPEQLADDVPIFLACLRGSLCLYCNAAGDETKVQIWVKEKGVVKNCWKELMTIENVQTSISSFKPLCLVENKILIQLDRGTFVFYSPSDKTYEALLDGGLGLVDLVPYLDSLFFPGIKMLPRRIPRYATVLDCLNDPNRGRDSLEDFGCATAIF